MPKKSKSAPLSLLPAVTHAALQRQAESPSAALDSPLRHPTVRETITAFEILIGGRQALIESLSTAGDGDAEIARILSAIADPRYDQTGRPTGLAKICQEADISPQALFAAFDRAAIGRGQILARLEAARAVPAVTKEIATQAVAHEDFCTRCNGVGTITEKDEQGTLVTDPCSTCNGVGALRRGGDPKQQDRILEIAGVVKKGAVPQVVVPITNVPPPAGPDFLRLQQDLAESLYRSRRPTEPIIEATTEPPPPEDPPT